MRFEKAPRQYDIREQLIDSILRLQQFNRIPDSILNVLYFLGLLQFILFSNNSLGIQTPINQLWYLKLFSRPDLIISDKNFGYLLPLCTIILFEFIPILMKGSRRCTNYLRICSFYQKIQPFYLYIPLSGLCFNSIYYNIQENQDLIACYFNTIISLITLICLFLLNFLRILLCKETIDLEVDCFTSIKLTFLDFLIQFLIIFQFIVEFVPEFNYLIQNLTISITSLLILINVFSLTNCKFAIININIIVSSYGFIQSILLLINQKSDISGKINGTLYLTVPLLSYILIKVYEWWDSQIISNTKKVTIRNQKYIFAKFVNDSFESIGQKIMTYTYVICQYKLKKEVDPIAQLPMAFLNDEIVPKHLLAYYYRIQLKKYVKELNNIDVKLRNGNHYIHYASILFRLGFQNLALKQINMILNNQNMYSISKSYTESKIRSLNTVTAGGGKSLSKSSKSQDVQEYAFHQISKSTKMLASTGSHNILSFYQKARVKILREKVRDKLRQQFKYREQSHSLDLQKGIELFLKSEKRNISLKDQIINLVNCKLQFFIQLQQAKHIRSIQLFIVSKKLCEQIQNLERKINKLYTFFPSQRIQSLYTYFQGELLDNYLDAYKITCNSSIQDDKLMTLHADAKFTFFNKDLIYVNVRFIDETQDLVIRNITPQICKFFNMNYDDLKINNSIDQLLPDAIRNEHILLVQRFLQTSQSKFYLKKNLNFLRQFKNIIKPCEFFFEINFSDTSEISFLAFFNDTYQTSAFLMVDVNCALGGITKNLFDKLNFLDYYLENLKSSCLTNTPIELLIPNFQHILSQNQILCQTGFRFLKQSILFNSFHEDDERNAKNCFSEWSKEDNILQCESIIQIHSCDIYGFQYYVVEIKELKSENLVNSTLRNSIDSAFSSISDQEAIINSPQIFKVDTQKIELYGRNFKLFDLEQPESSKYEINLMSPADMSMNPVALNSANPLLKLKQQEFFNQICQIQDPYSLQISSIKQGKAIDLEDMNPRQKKEDTNSSSFAGVKKSQFYKKYEMTQSILRPYYPKQLKILIVLLSLSFIVCSIHNIIIMTKNYDDLRKFIQEIDMIELHSSFMAPHDIFVAMRIAIVTYNEYASAGAITIARANELTAPFYDNIQIGYSEIKEVFNQQLSNQNLQPFFEDRTIGMIFMGNNFSDVFNKTLNIREALQQLIQNLFQFQYRYVYKMGTAGTAIQVFGVANQFHLHFWLEDLTLEILDYSKNRSQNIISDWTIIWVLFLVISFTLTIIELKFYRQYYSRYDKYLNFFKFCNQNKLSFEIERYKMIQKQLVKDPDQIFSYRFDLLFKEQQLQTQAKIQEQLNKKNKDSIKYESLPIVLGLSLIFGIWIVYLSLGVIIFQGEITYLNKYSDTVDVYKLIQDMTISSATLYQNRDFHLIWQNFTYLTNKDEQQIYQLINSGIQNIQKFNLFTTNFDSIKYQVSEDFITFFSNIQKDNICKVLGEEVMGFLAPFCPISIEGNYLQGVTTALNYISNTIQTQMVINNFTKRIDFPLYDNEAGIIMVRVFQLMTQKLKSSMLTVTQSLISITTVLSAIYIIFAFLSILILYFIISKQYHNEYLTVKRFVQLLPASVTLLNDQFERYIRILLIEEQD